MGAELVTVRVMLPAGTAPDRRSSSGSTATKQARHALRRYYEEWPFFTSSDVEHGAGDVPKSDMGLPTAMPSWYPMRSCATRCST